MRSFTSWSAAPPHGPAAPQISYWMQTAGDLAPREPLDRSVDVDVAILGAGYTGLWTALRLLERQPSLRVAICEAHVAGFGASGRNGGWCVPSLGVTPRELARRTSADTARRTVEALRRAVDDVGAVCRQQGVDSEFRKTGVLRIARGPHELPALRAGWRALEDLRLSEGCALLDAEALAERVTVHGGAGAIFDPHAATVHPGKLVRGLARLVEAAGGVVYERTPVTFVRPRSANARPALCTAAGDVRADTVVLAGEAYLSQLPGMRRAVLPLYSLIVLTEPLSDEQWAQIGWAGGESLSSQRLTVDYLTRTADGRILFGGRGAPYHFGSRITDAYDRHEPTHARLRRSLREWFPALDGVGFTHAWGGPLGLPRDWMPVVRLDPAAGVAAAYGYTGQGVAAAALAGQALADLITGAASALTQLPMVNHRPRRWEPEPLRWLAARYLQLALARVDTRAERTGAAPTGRTLAERLMRH
ncbi:MAG TPA: FAD-dependent oxidoreductase [Egibacteraceae bacterium]|nr:FAD-dependent oxidoreductase [Egibacteraceae bacterium]